MAVNTDSYQTKPRSCASTRQLDSISFRKLQTAKDCYKYSLFPRTFAEWNCIPASIRSEPTVGQFKTGINHIEIGDIINKAHFIKIKRACSVIPRLHVYILNGIYAVAHQNQNQNLLSLLHVRDKCRLPNPIVTMEIDIVAISVHFPIPASTCETLTIWYETMIRKI